MASGNGGTGLGVRGDGKGVLIVPADLPLFRHFFGGQAHAVGDGDVLIGKDGRIHRHLVTHHLRHDAHRLGAGGDHHVGQAKADLIGGVSHRLHAG